MQGISFWWLVIQGYVLFFLIGIEILFEPFVRKLRWWLFIFLLVATVWFGIAIPFAAAPLEITGYLRPVDYPAGAPIGGIPWNSHFTDLRIVISNSTADDYLNADISITPDTWTHEAGFPGSSLGCQLVRIDGSIIWGMISSKLGAFTTIIHRVGEGFEAYDDLGNSYSPLASRNGYRITCAKIPSHSSVQLVFAVVSVTHCTPTNPNILPGVGACGRNLPINNIFDALESKPSPKTVLVQGKYVRGLKPYSIRQNINVPAP
jgi:hypothetical protein